MPTDLLLNTPTEDVIGEMYERHHTDIPILKRNEAYLEPPVEIEIRRNDYGRDMRLRGTLLGLVVPYEGEGGLFYMRSNMWGGTPRANLYNNNLVLTMRGVDLQKDAVNRHFASALEEVERYLTSQRGMTKDFEQTFPQRLRHFIDSRKQRLLADQNLVAGLAFPIRARGDAPQTYVAPVIRKKIISTPPKTAAPFKPEPVLAEDDYQHILTVIDGMTRTMERNPTTFAKLDEEQLRDMFLVPLNGHFEGAATGETFNASGKTDIIIRVDDRNIFIAECKVWRGPKYLTEAIDQLFTYLTWRDTRAAIIVFNRNKDFSAVLASMQAAVTGHPARKHGPTVEGESRLRCVFGHPNDSNREIIVTVLAFDVPT